MTFYKIALILLFMSLRYLLQAQESNSFVLLNAGFNNILERDRGYSPLLYTGNSLAFSLGYVKTGVKKDREVYAHLSNHLLKNSFNAELKGLHGSVLAYTFYRTSWLPEALNIGWSNSNEVSVRNFRDAQNFNPRFDFHTSFGPALRYQYRFGERKQWRFSSQGHWQVIGFTFMASYVTSPPDAFLHEESWFRAFMQTIELFQPFKQHNFGMLNQVFYQLPNANEIGLGYRFNYTSIDNAHRSQRSSGFYFFQLNFKL